MDANRFGYIIQVDDAVEIANERLLQCAETIQFLENVVIESQNLRDDVLTKIQLVEKERNEAKECYQLQKDAFNLMKEAAEDFKKERDEAMMSAGYSNPDHEPLIETIKKLRTERDILLSKQSQYESTMKETMRVCDELRAELDMTKHINKS